MDQRDHGPDKSQAPANDKEPAQGRRRLADASAHDGNWGVGAASAMDNLRRHNWGARHSSLVDPDDERPSSD